MAINSSEIILESIAHGLKRDPSGVVTELSDAALHFLEIEKSFAERGIRISSDGNGGWIVIDGTENLDPTI